MADAALKLMTPEEFLLWDLDQEVRHELVDGVPIEMMTGASGMHDEVVTNVIYLLKHQLRGTSCRVGTADTAVRTKIRAIRRADVIVTCDPPRIDRYEAIEPRLVVEVLSPSNVGLAWDRKLREYRRHKSLQYIVLLDSRFVAATLYARIDSGWDELDFDEPEAVIDLPAIGCRLKMADVYNGTELKPGPVIEQEWKP
jgi:Uma2 family endonuclease